jgi:putative ABC transport system permease protein
MEQLRLDLRYAVRSFIKNPGFLSVAVVTLALGIGANTAIFSIVNAVLLQPLPYPEPERLAGFRSNESFLDLLDVQAQTATFESLAGVALAPMDFTGGAEPVQAMVGLTTPNFFRTLGARAELGRLIEPNESTAGSERLVVLSNKFWKEQVNSDQNVIGRQMPFGGDSYTVVGVLPTSFRPPREAPDAFVSLAVGYPAAAQARGVHFLRAYGRLKPGVSLAQARAEMGVIDQRLAAANPADSKNRRTVLVPLQERVVGQSRETLLILFGAVGLVLLVACANFANLLLSRAAVREQEMVVRAALGARKWRMMRQLLTESVAIALLGGAVGMVLAVWGLDLLVSLQPANLPRLEEIRLDPWVFTFTFGVSLMTGIVFGLAPAWQAARVDVASALKEGGRSATSGAARQRVRSIIVVAEIAMAMILLVGAGLLIRSLWQLRNVAPGFDGENVVSMKIDLPERGYREIPLQTRYREQILSKLNSVPGLEAAIISEVPLSGSALDHDFLIEGRPPITPGDEPSLFSRSVMGNYFGVMRIPLRAGRDFNAGDNEGRPLVGIVNEEMVRTYFPNESPIGKRVRWARATGAPEWIEIVGVAADVKHFGLDQAEAPALYWPYSQSRQPWKRWSQVVVRTISAPEAMIQTIKKQIWSVDPKVSINNLNTMSSLTASSYAARRLNMILLALFSAIALTLAAVGIYGVMSYAVSQRTHEIGIRMALGAQASDVLRLIGRQGVMLVGIGIVIGTGGALVLTRVMAGLLYRVSAGDPRTFIGIILLVTIVAFLACYLPARRATRVDPMEALRSL